LANKIGYYLTLVNEVAGAPDDAGKQARMTRAYMLTLGVVELLTFTTDHAALRDLGQLSIQQMLIRVEDHFEEKQRQLALPRHLRQQQKHDHDHNDDDPEEQRKKALIAQVTKQIRHGNLSTATDRITNDTGGPVPITPDIKEELKRKTGANRPPPVWPATTAAEKAQYHGDIDALTTAEILKAAKALSTGKNPGASQFTPEVLVLLLSHDTNPSVPQAATTFLKNVLKGKAPPEVLSFLLAGSMVAFPKGDETHRPVVMVSGLRKVLDTVFKNRWPSGLCDNMALGVPNGAAAMVTALEGKAAAPGYMIGKFDVSNAHSNINGPRLFTELLAVDSFQANYVRTCMGADIGGLRVILDTTAGIEFLRILNAGLQGAPLVANHFAWEIREALRNTQARYPDVLNLAFADDGSGAGPIPSFLQALKYYRESLKARDYDIKIPSLEGFSASLEEDTTYPLWDGASITVSKTGMQLLGVPVGTDNYKSKIFELAINNGLQKLDSIMTRIVSRQHQSILVSNCVAPAFNFAAASTPFTLAAAASFKRVPLALQQVAATIAGFSVGAGVDLPPEWDLRVQHQVRSPLQTGGLGLGVPSHALSVLKRAQRLASSASRIWPIKEEHKFWLTQPPPGTSAYKITASALPVFIDTHTQAEDRASFPSSPQEFFRDATNPDRPPTNLNKISARSAIAFHRSTLIPLVATSLTHRHQLLALQKSLEQSGANDGLGAIPTSKMLELSNHDMATAYCMRLLIASPLVIPRELARLPCNCNANGQRHGEIVSLEHLLICPGKSVHIDRHEKMVELIAFLGRNADQRVKLRDTSYGTGEKYADCFTSLNGKQLALDVSIRSGILSTGSYTSTLKKATTTGLAFADAAEAEKRAHYSNMYAAEGVEFFPLIVETPSGAFGKGLISYLNLQQSHIDNNHVEIAYASSFQTRRSYTAFARQVIACAFIRESAAMIHKSLKFTARARGMRGAF
jgi:hypothetical protein